MTPREKFEANWGAAPRCTEMSAETDRPCESNAIPGYPRCVKHRDLPDDADRCEHVWHGEYEGRRCPRRKLKTGTGRFCAIHYVRTGKAGRQPKGELPQRRPCPVCGKVAKGKLGCRDHAPTCSGTRADMLPCTRPAVMYVDGLPVCAHHKDRLVTPPPPPLTGPAPLCGIPCGLYGASCRQPLSPGETRCHRHPVVADADRCQHRYESGDRCPARNRRSHGHGHGVYCGRHVKFHVCSRCGGNTGRGDGLCAGCAPRCSATASITGRRCEHPAVPGQTVCGLYHLDDGAPRDGGRRRCEHRHDNGDRCVRWLTPRSGVDGVVWTVYCQTHRIPCVAPDCEAKTGFADGLCPAHRPECSEPGCVWFSARDGLCARHWLVAAGRRCTVETKKGQCGNPVPAGQFVCGTHSRLPEPEHRCCWCYESGEQCTEQRHVGRYCLGHAPAASRPCEWVTTLGKVCGKPAVPRDDEPDGIPSCEIHRRVPADEDRCVAEVAPGHRCPGSRWTGSEGCFWHAPRATCQVYTPLGVLCGKPYVVREGRPAGCHWHDELPADQKRCVIEVAPGHRCPGEREPRTETCQRHGWLRSRCQALYRSGRGCRNHVVNLNGTCDRHFEWVPGTFVDDVPTEWVNRFVIGPRLAEFAALMSNVADRAYDTQQLSNQSGWREGNGMPQIVAGDPFDITGAQALYETLIADGKDPAVAERMARRVGATLSDETIRGITSSLRRYFEWCDDRNVTAIPADPLTVIEYLDYYTLTPIEDGRPLQAGTLKSFQHALTRAHQARNLPNPFDQSRLLTDWLRGYRREFERMPVQAHALVKSEVARMIDSLTQPDSLRLREEVIVTVILDLIGVRGADNPALTMNRKMATRLMWEGVHLSAADEATPSVLTIARPNGGEDTLLLPNRAGEYVTSGQQAAPGEFPLAVRMCGTSALRSLRIRLRQESESGTEPTGPVLTNQTNRAMSDQGLTDAIARLARAAGVQPRQAVDCYTFDERVRMLESLYQPSPMALRDAALILIMWECGLRRSESVALDVGEIRMEATGKGLWVLVRKSKGNFVGSMRAVRWSRKRDGSPRLTCAVTAWLAWQTAYEQMLGRPLQADDPAFPNIQNRTGVRMTDKNVNNIVTNAARFAGIQVQPWERLSSHGLRAGQATDLLMAGMPAQIVAQMQGRESVVSLQSYIRLTDPFEAFLTLDEALYDAFDDRDSFDPSLPAQEIAAENTQVRRRKGRRGNRW